MRNNWKYLTRRDKAIVITGLVIMAACIYILVFIYNMQ